MGLGFPKIRWHLLRVFLWLLGLDSYSDLNPGPCTLLHSSGSIDTSGFRTGVRETCRLHLVQEF